MPQPLPTKPKAWVAITLTWNAGFVDAAGYLLLFHIYTAHMSGHSVALGTYTAQVQWRTALLQNGWPVLTFVLGLFLASLINEAGGRRHLKSVSSITLGLETAFLAAFIFCAPHFIVPGGIKDQPPIVFGLLLPLLTMAMGLQTSSLMRVGGLSLELRQRCVNGNSLRTSTDREECRPEQQWAVGLYRYKERGHRCVHPSLDRRLTYDPRKVVGGPNDPNTEPLNQNQPAGSAAFFAGNQEFITRKLWGLYNSGPFMHHGQFTTMREAILAHHGEAEASERAFAALSDYDRNSIIEFLKSLQVLPPGTQSLCVDQDSRSMQCPPGVQP